MSQFFHYIRERLQQGVQRLPYLLRGLALIWHAAPQWTVIWLILLAVQGLLPAVSVYLTKWLVNSLVLVIQEQASWDTLWPTLLLIAAMGLILVLQEGLRSATVLVRTNQSELVTDYASTLVHNKSMEIDMAYYDKPEYYDQLHRARAGIAYRSIAVLDGLGNLLQNGITLVAMVFVLLPYGWWLPLALVVSTLPAFFVVLQHRQRYHLWYLRNTEDERMTYYYDWLLTARETAAELRLFHLSDHFQDGYMSIRRRLRDERLKLLKGQSLSEMLAGFAALLVTGLAMVVMIWRTLQGLFNLGDLALFYQAFNQGQSLMRTFVQNVGEIYSNSFFLGDLFEFMELKPQVTEPENPLPFPEHLQDGIRFENVTFQYPGSQHPTLCNFDLYIPADKTVAFVGPNGAGKSTLIKLMCRFYDPQEGAIKIDGIDLRNFALKELRQGLTVLFQEPVHFSATARHNIELGRMEPAAELQEIKSMAEAAGADEPIERLPQQYETLLGKWFKGGADLSVGEWQRVALARAFLRRAPVMILDEPTSAMDPWAEADWLERFRQLSAGCTAILITHRFTTAAFADMIFVIEDGHIVESGSHHKLVQDGGHYAASWQEQMHRWAIQA
jgi:ATP-binding cassette, subfamily B, bacterial